MLAAVASFFVFSAVVMKSESGLQCVLWTRYLNDSAPLVNGFSAGVAVDGSQAYVARVLSNGVQPARIKLSEKGGGLILFYAVVTETDDLQVNKKVNLTTAQGGEYLVVQKGCHCSWQTPNDTRRHTGTVFPISWFASFGRRISKRGHVDLTKINELSRKQYYVNETGYFLTDKLSEVLVCESEKRPEVPVVASPNRACAYWAPFRNDDAPSKHGLALSVGITNQILYIGRAFDDDLIVQKTGRFQTEDDKGVYLSDLKEQFGHFPEYLLMTSDCLCWFADFKDALKQRGVVLTMSGRGFGRRKLTQGRMAVTDVDVKRGFESWMNEKSQYVNNSCHAMLVCEVIT